MSRKPLIASAAALLLPVILLGCGAGDPPAAKQSPTAMSKSDSASPATSAPAKTPVSSVTVTGAANASGLPPLAIEDTGRVATLPASC